MADETAQLYISLLSNSTLTSYNRTIEQFYQFLVSYDAKAYVFPVNTGYVMFYINYLYRQGFSPATITSKLSAIAYLHQMFNKSDPTDHFLVRKLMRNLRRKTPQRDARLPVSPNMLLKMLNVVPTLALSAYNKILYQAMFSLSYAAFLRPGEVTGSLHCLQFENVKFVDKTIVIRFNHFKHSDGTPFILKVPPTFLRFCPVRMLKRFLKIRRRVSGPLFCKANAEPVTYREYSGVFQKVVERIGFPGKYSHHSMRIGVATYAASVGYSDMQLRYYSGWQSAAVSSYIRFPIIPV